MNGKNLARCIAICLGSACLTPGLALATNAQSDNDALSRKMEAMQQQISALQQQLDELRKQQAAQQQANKTQQETGKVNSKKIDKLAKAREKEKEASKEGIEFGGAMRFQYSYESYDKGNKDRIGDTDFDIFRLNMRGTYKGIDLNAEWRWFQYMSAIKYAWIGHHFNDNSQIQIGLTRIPFGNQAFNSHNYFFSSNYYVGLEDTYHAGVEYVYSGDPWNVQLAFFKNDAMGGVDGYVSDRSNSYSYNVVGVRGPDEGIYADPQNPAGSADTAAARVAYTFKPGKDLSVEVGGSALHGNLEGPSDKIGDYDAWAVHANANYKGWNFQAQAMRYDYNTDSGADRLAVGAYAFYDTIAASANGWSLNARYHQPVDWGPIQSLDFYNDYSRIYHKSGGLPMTYMNVLGVGASAGYLYTYFDFVTGRNQPFVGGSMAGDGDTEHRFNINFGFYF